METTKLTILGHHPTAYPGCLIFFIVFTDSPYPHKQVTRGFNTIQATSFFPWWLLFFQEHFEVKGKKSREITGLEINTARQMFIVTLPGMTIKIQHYLHLIALTWSNSIDWHSFCTSHIHNALGMLSVNKIKMVDAVFKPVNFCSSVLPTELPVPIRWSHDHNPVGKCDVIPT